MGKRRKTLPGSGSDSDEEQHVAVGKSLKEKKGEWDMEGCNAAIRNQSGGASGGLFASCTFVDLGLHPTLCQHLQDKMGFQVPTMVQAQAIPVVISGRHLKFVVLHTVSAVSVLDLDSTCYASQSLSRVFGLVNAATGTGKTIVYLAPIVHLLQMQSPKIERADGTFAIVLVPTRELCMQVYEILQKLLHRFHWIVPGYLMGGENRSKEKARLRKGISILIATPGRLLDHLKNTSSFSYKNLRWIVFDEADRILELGFGKSIEEILDFLSSRQSASSDKEKRGAILSKFSRQNLLLSATLNEKVNHLANISLENPVMIGLDKKVPCDKSRLVARNERHVTFNENDEPEVLNAAVSSNSIDDYNLPEQLVQRYVKVPCGSRLAVLLSILKYMFERDASQKIVVFFSTCDAVNFHHSLVSQFHWSSDSLVEEQKKVFLKCKTMRLHGNMEHDERRTTFQEFNSEKSALLFCTDVAARGLDFPKVRCIIQYDSPGEATEYVHRVGRTARLGEKGEALLFLQPIEIDYLHDLQKHGVSLQEYPLQKVISSVTLYGQKYNNRSMMSLEMHPWVLALQRALEILVSCESKMKSLAKDAFCSWVRAYTAHRGDLKKIFMVKKLHLGHVARSFGLKEQPSLVGKSFQMQTKKRKKDQKNSALFKKRRVAKKH